jgi:hypothetical protein
MREFAYQYDDNFLPRVVEKLQPQKRTEAMILDLDLPQLKLCVRNCGDGGNPATVFCVSPTDITKSLLHDFGHIDIHDLHGDPQRLDKIVFSL